MIQLNIFNAKKNTTDFLEMSNFFSWLDDFVVLLYQSIIWANQNIIFNGLHVTYE